MRHGWLGHVKVLRQLPGRHLAALQQFYNPPPGWVGQGLEHLIQSHRDHLIRYLGLYLNIDDKETALRNQEQSGLFRSIGGASFQCGTAEKPVLADVAMSVLWRLMARLGRT